MKIAQLPRLACLHFLQCCRDAEPISNLTKFPHFIQGAFYIDVREQTAPSVVQVAPSYPYSNTNQLHPHKDFRSLEAPATRQSIQLISNPKANTGGVDALQYRRPTKTIREMAKSYGAVDRVQYSYQPGTFHAGHDKYGKIRDLDQAFENAMSKQ